MVCRFWWFDKNHAPLFPFVSPQLVKADDHPHVGLGLPRKFPSFPSQELLLWMLGFCQNSQFARRGEITVVVIGCTNKSDSTWQAAMKPTGDYPPRVFCFVFLFLFFFCIYGIFLSDPFQSPSWVWLCHWLRGHPLTSNGRNLTFKYIHCFVLLGNICICFSFVTVSAKSDTETPRSPPASQFHMELSCHVNFWKLNETCVPK